MLQTNSYNHRDAGEESLGNAFWSFGWDIWFKNIKIKIKKKKKEKKKMMMTMRMVVTTMMMMKEMKERRKTSWLGARTEKNAVVGQQE